MKYRHPNLVYQDTQGIMELDIFIPELNLAFEYQVEIAYKLSNEQRENNIMNKFMEWV